MCYHPVGFSRILQRYKNHFNQLLHVHSLSVSLLHVCLSFCSRHETWEATYSVTSLQPCLCFCSYLIGRQERRARHMAQQTSRLLEPSATAPTSRWALPWNVGPVWVGSHHISSDDSVTIVLPVLEVFLDASNKYVVKEVGKVFHGIPSPQNKLWSLFEQKLQSVWDTNDSAGEMSSSSRPP